MKYQPPPDKLLPGSVVDIYLRDSGGEGQERSVDSQLSEVKEFCILYNLVSRRVYRDEAKTGRGTISRKNFDRMIEDYKSNDDNPLGLLIWDYARFARNTKDAIYSIATIEHHGIIIHSLIDYVPEGEFRDVGRVMKHMGNQAESEKNSMAVKRMQHQLVRNHKAMFGARPRGFKREPLPPVINERTGELRTLHKWIPDPLLAPLILRAFEMRAAHATISEIRTATGLYKASNCYTTFFLNKIYKGVLEFGGEVFEDYCEPIVPPELWDQVDAIRRATRPGNKTLDPRRVRSDYLLSGLITCQQCGSLLVGHRVKNWYYYACPKRKRTGECSAAHIQKDKIERGILDALENTFTLETLVYMQGQIAQHRQRDQNDLTRARLRLDRDAASVRKKISNLTSAIAKHGHSESLLNALDAFEEEKAHIKLQIIELEKEKSIPRHKLPELRRISKAIKRVVTHGTFDEKRTLIRTFITRIIAAKSADGEVRAMLYYLPINILNREKELGLAQVPPRGQWDEAQLEIVIPKV